MSDSAVGSPHDPEVRAFNDGNIDRNRGMRWLIAIASCATTVLLPAWFGWRVTTNWFAWGTLGFWLGILASLPLLRLTVLRSFITVRLNRAFVTVNALASMFKSKKVYTVYLPGVHPCYWWELRDAANNLSLHEAAEAFTAPVIAKDGIVFLEGSFRLRPASQSAEDVVIFLGGVAAVAGETADLIRAKIVEFNADKTVEQVRSTLEALNDELKSEFVTGRRDDGLSDFEKRFAVDVGDVTVARVRGTAEEEKTRAALDEANIIAEGTAIIAGFKERDGKKAREHMEEARTAGTIKQDQIDRARDRFMAASDNIKMSLTANEFNLTLNADPDTAAALAALVPHLPTILRNTNKGK